MLPDHSHPLPGAAHSVRTHIETHNHIVSHLYFALRIKITMNNVRRNRVITAGKTMTLIKHFPFLIALACASAPPLTLLFARVAHGIVGVREPRYRCGKPIL